MTATESWARARQHQGVTLNRLTKDGPTGMPFTFRIRDSVRGPSIGFFRDGREVKSASLDRYHEVYEGWSQGNRNADQFRNKGRKESRMEVAVFLIPLFEFTARIG
jgi:hypothetical protein